MNMQERIAEVCDDVKELLIKKNKAYGNSALNPVRIFSKANTIEQIKVRLDDKLSRLARGVETESVPEDVDMDILGYLVLLRIAKQDAIKMRLRQENTDEGS